MPHDHYKVLGVPRNATPEEIQRAFRTQARRVHPDLSARTDAAARFQELSTAYQVLNDPQRRARYDHVTLKREPTLSFGPIVIRLSAVFRWLG